MRIFYQPKKRYNTRGVKAKPSAKQAQNEDHFNTPSSKYGAYPTVFSARYIAGAQISMDPQSYQEAMDHPDVDKWRTAIHKDYSQIHKKTNVGSVQAV